jgi:hypothetical protein
MTLSKNLPWFEKEVFLQDSLRTKQEIEILVGIGTG